MGKPFVRSTTNKYIAGVCGGIAAYLNVDATLVRVGMVLLTLLLQIGWLIYPALWLLMPTDNGGESGMGQLRNWMKQSEPRR